MKTSLYNTVLPISDTKTLIYNALSDKYLVVSGYDLNSQSLLSVSQSDLRSKLEAIGAIIPRNVDEVQQLKDMITKIDNDQSAFSIHVNPTLDCNFRCWYCYEQHHVGSRMSSATCEAVEALIKRIVSQNKSLNTLYLSFFGGEPLMAFSNVVEPLIMSLERICNERGIQHSVHFTTNGGLINKKMLDFFAKHNASFQITLDGYRPYHDNVRKDAQGKGSYDCIMANIKSLAAGGNKVLIRINYTKDNLDSLPDIISDLDLFPQELRHCISVNIQRVWQDVDNTAEDDRTLKVLNCVKTLTNMGFAASSHMVHDVVRNSCYGDKRNYLLVNFDGKVYSCTARDFNEKNSVGVLNQDGTVTWKDNALEKRMAAKFSKPVCHTCRIAPLCGGGCRQMAVEHTDPDKCMYDYTDDQIDKMVADRFEFNFISKNISNTFKTC